MAHQCLECGEVYEEGSPELLKGCASCGGTRFFFTQAPVSDEDRREIREQAEEDLEGIVRDLLDEDLKPDYDDDIWSADQRSRWLAVDPDTAGRTLKEYVEEMTDEPEGDVPDGLEDLVDDADEGVMDAVAIDFVGQDDEPDGTDEAVVEADRFIDPEPKPVEEAEPPPKPEPGDDAGAGQDAEPVDPTAVPEAMWTPDEEPEDDEEASRPEVVTVAEPGRYEIDVEALMDDSPIIVQNDGSYLVHLPSLFRSRNLRR